MQNPHNPAIAEDIGFNVRSDGDLVLATPVGAQMRPGCGMIRLANGDITFDGTDPSIGFLFRNSSGDLQFRTT